MATEVWTSPVDCDVTDAYEPQVIPAGVEIRCQIDPEIQWNDEAKIINMKLKPLELPASIDPSKPVKSIEWPLYLPNPGKDDAEKINNKKLRLRPIKQAFGIAENANLAPGHFAGKIVKALTKERKQNAAETAQYGRRAEVERIVEVES